MFHVIVLIQCLLLICMQRLKEKRKRGGGVSRQKIREYISEKHGSCNLAVCNTIYNSIVAYTLTYILLNCTRHCIVH